MIILKILAWIVIACGIAVAVLAAAAGLQDEKRKEDRER